VLIDANQNGPGRTIAFAYSVRPKAGAPVSTPVTWDELRAGVDPDAFTMSVVLDRLSRHGDLHAPVLEDRQALGPALKSL
jgi:DNA primase